MSNIPSDKLDPVTRQAAVEAAGWLSRLNSRVVDTVELEEYFAWRRIPHNAKAYDELETLWRSSLRLADDPEIAHALDGATFANRDRGRGIRLAIVAGFAVLLACAAFFMLARDTVFETAIGEQRLVQLEDGSRIRLDTNTRINVRMDSERSVRLVKGRAFFDVAHDSSTSFLVSAGDARIQALGTQFEVDDTVSGTRIALVEGRVAVTTRNPSPALARVELAPGQMVNVAASGLERVMAADTRSITAWTQGRLDFRQTPLVQAVAEVNRYARKPLRLTSTRWAQQEVNGGFAVGDVQAFVEAVTTLYPLEAFDKPDGAIELRDR
ncbi:FecR family protein [Blastomonas sp.]|uniref:FecR family protein n=1 Tax=Blastomonas sp. TaxID=1909299 RepID=UPI00261B102D|nr:FecR domain-containing protein [Blastomonas sp.]MDM7955794.1 FecR domain-containing protein [Blastomonas sp.]